MHQCLDIGDVRQGQNAVTVDLLIVCHIARQYRQTYIHPPQKGLNLDHFGHVARGDREFIEGAGLCLVQRHP